MRPEILFPLFANLETLSGIGPRFAKLLASLTGDKIVDLLWHLPTGIVDRRFEPDIPDAPDGTICTFTVTIGAHQKPATKRLPYRVACHNDSGEIDLVFFHARGDYLQKSLPEGQVRVISGKVERYHGKAQMPHPDHMVPVSEKADVAIVEPVYPLTQGLTTKTVRKAVSAALERVKDMPEWADNRLIEREGWPTWLEALSTAHAPTSLADLEPTTPARRRLAYDELLANQLALALIRAHEKKRAGRVIKGDGHLRAKAAAALPFSLTGSQSEALDEIYADMAIPARMLRLLQGDVGSGKTVVALMAMLNAVETGAQAALMAPTEILARQHLATMEPLAEAAGVGIIGLTGRDKGKARTELLERLRSGEAGLAVGTHALFQDDIEFKDLALAVVDEQHRFGVHQRLALGSKGANVDLLVMTATPIPRTLTMTAYGDLDASRLREKPPGRQPVKTVTIPAERINDVVAAVGRAISSDAKVYWVCPLVEESDKIDLAAAEDRAKALEISFPGKVALVHGKMKAKEKDTVMSDFKDGDKDILVATTVIEVGVDVPQATVMVIEHAERFGLSQLHQLRGRIGRGDRASTCLLLYHSPLSETADARIRTIRDTEDGFEIAEKDLELRGAGEVLGTRQSGLPTFRCVDMAAHGDLMAVARDDGRLALDRDEDLLGDRGKALRTLLYLFERDAAVLYLRSG